MNAICLIFLCFLASCTAAHNRTLKLLTPGDNIHIDYTCHGPDGSLIAASAPGVFEDQPVSPLFASHKLPRPISYVVPSQIEEIDISFHMPMEEKIERYLLRMSPGKPASEKVTLFVEGETFTKDQGGYSLTVPINSVKTRNVTMSASAFERAYGMPPTVGIEKETKIPGVSARVMSINADKVNILYSAPTGTRIHSLFGEQILTQNEKNFLVRTDVREGDLVRNGKNLVGRVTEVDKKNFVVDFSHPFGFETLTCDVIFNPD